MGLALAPGGVAFILQQTGVLRDSGPWLFVAIAGYLSVIGLIGWRLHHARRAGNALVGLTIGCDLVFIFWSTVASATPAYYYRILILAFFVLHLTESYFGRRHAALALAAVSLGYAGLTFEANRIGAQLAWAEQLWSLGLFAIAGVVFIVQYGSFRLRLERIVAHPFLVNGKRMHLTISIGVASTSAIGNDPTGRTMIERADEALYDAKRSGRDGARVWNGELVIV